MSFVKNLKCRECGQEYKIEPLYICEWCFGPLEVVYDYASAKKIFNKENLSKDNSYSLWRYKALLPLSKEPCDGLFSGFTPLIKADNLAKALGVDCIYIKDDTVNHPTLSFKDRVVAVAISKAKEFGYDTVACASTGNLANALSAQAAIARLKSYIFIPANLEATKILVSSVYNTNLVKIRGNYDQVNRLCVEIANRYNWAFVNINIRPYYAEGSKTLLFEIIEALNWQTPEHIVVPVAGGSLISKIYKALQELFQLGLISQLNTKLYAAQPEGCCPVVSAVKEKRAHIKPVKPNTICKSLAIGNPADGYYAYKSVVETGGWAETASDEEIIEGIKLLAQTEGIFTETAGGVVVAVAKKLITQGIIPKNERIVLCITASGLKTQEVLLDKELSKSWTIEPNLASFEEVIKNAN